MFFIHYHSLFIVQHILIENKIMSLVLLSGLQYFKYRILKINMLVIYLNPFLTCAICAQNKAIIRNKVFLCFNYHLFQHKYKESIVICPKCLENERKKFPLLYFTLSELLSLLKMLWDKNFYQEGMKKTINIKKVIKDKGKFHNWKPQLIDQMTKYLQMKFYGFYNIEKNLSKKKCNKEKVSLIQLLESFSYQIRQTYLGHYSIDRSQEKHLHFNVEFLKMMSGYITREKEYKLQILGEMQKIAQQTMILQNLSSYFHKLLKGIDNFQKSFHKNLHNEKLVIFSMNRSSIQYRQLNLNLNNQKFDSQLIRTELYYAGKPIIFKVSTCQQFDFVQLGMILIPKASQPKEKHFPINLYRFMIYPRGKLEYQSFIDDQTLHQQPTKAEFKQKQKINKEPHLRIFQNASDLFKCKRLNDSQEIYEIQTQDQLILSFNTSTFSIQNKTTQTLLIQQKLKSQDYSLEYFLYPCVRLIGNKVIIENHGFVNA